MEHFSCRISQLSPSKFSRSFSRFVSLSFFFLWGCRGPRLLSWKRQTPSSDIFHVWHCRSFCAKTRQQGTALITGVDDPCIILPGNCVVFEAYFDVSSKRPLGSTEPGSEWKKKYRLDRVAARRVSFRLFRDFPRILHHRRADAPRKVCKNV